MKITHIEKTDETVYIITHEASSFWEKLFGKKMETTKYKQLEGQTYKKTNQPAYIAEDGGILDCFDEVIIAIENYERKF